MSSSSRPEFPRESMQKYFALCSSLRKAMTISDALAKTCKSEKISGDPSLPKISDEDHNICTETLRSAGSWVAAALSTDLASVSSYDESRESDNAAYKAPSRGRLGVFGTIANGQDLEAGRDLRTSSSKRCSPSPSPTLRQPSPSRVVGRMNPSVLSRSSARKQAIAHENRLPQAAEKKLIVSSHEKNSTIIKNDALQVVRLFDKDLHFAESLVNKWVQGHKIIGVAELARQLQCEAQRWFFKYMEEALDCGFHFNRVPGSVGLDRRTSNDGSTLASAFPQLKQLNDWIGQLDLETLDSHMLEVLDRLKKKICVFLLQHVETASTKFRQSL